MTLKDFVIFCQTHTTLEAMRYIEDNKPTIAGIDSNDCQQMMALTCLVASIKYLTDAKILPKSN